MTRKTNETSSIGISSTGMSLRLIYLLLIVLFSLVYRWSISLFPHSGQGKPKLYGDYEAQRHWMEITYNLKLNDWYRNTSENDLNYWGLDYPLLTAYHSYLMGFVANKIDPTFVALHESRGIETTQHKLFMRLTVFASDIIVYYPAALLLLYRIYQRSKKREANNDGFLFSSLLVLINPTLVLIDHGHFQYNSMSLGLALLAVYFAFDSKRHKSLLLASILFSMALNYKQMELYHALPFFFYLLGICLFKQRTYTESFIKLSLIGLSVIGTFVVIWLPILSIKLDMMLNVIERIFPFSRGLFEDKVANFWCSLSVLVKLREKFDINTLSKISLLVTALLNLPSGFNLLLKPSKAKFLLALVNSALIFFLFSFQVHEKSILLATVPACILVNTYPLVTAWFLAIANLSMLPLFIKDGLTIASLSSTIMFVLFVYLFYNNNNSSSETFWPTLNIKYLNNRYLFKALFTMSMLGSIILAWLAVCVRAPAKWPDLWVVAICVYCCLHFLFFSLIYHLIQFSLIQCESNQNDNDDDGNDNDDDKLIFKCSLFHPKQQREYSRKKVE